MKKPSSATVAEPTDSHRAPPRVRRVALTGDCQRFVAGPRGLDWFPRLNVAWLEHLLGLPGRCAQRGIAYTCVMPSTDPTRWAETVGDAGAAGAFRADPTQAWAQHYDDEAGQLFPAAHEALLTHDLVVGFELPKQIRRLLHAHGRRYLSLRIHPLRFLPDLCFAAATNCAVIARAAAAAAVPSVEIEARVCWMKALFARAGHPAFALPQGVPLLVGQTANDSVLLRGGSFVRWTDVEDRVLPHLEGHGEVALLPHPSNLEATALLRLATRRWGRTLIVTNANAYGVLCGNPDTPAVIALSSSLAVEAQALGLPAHLAHGHPCIVDALPEIEPELLMPLGHGLLAASFWDQVLGNGEALINPAPAPFAFGHNHVRDTLEPWAFAALRWGLRFPATVKRVYPVQALGEAKRAGVVRALAGFAENSAMPETSALNAANVAGITITVAPAPLAAHEVRTIEFNSREASHYLAKGFHEPESWGVWSAHHDAVIVVPVASQADNAPRNARVEIRLRAYRGIVAQAPVLRIASAGGALAYVVFRPRANNEHLLEIDVPVLDDEIHIDFHMSDTVSVAVIEGSGDSREVGFALTQMRVALQPPGESPRSPTSQLWGVAEAPLALTEAPGNPA